MNTALSTRASAPRCGSGRMAAAAAPCTHALSRTLARCRKRARAPDPTTAGACSATAARRTAARAATARASAGRAIASPVAASAIASAVGGSIAPADRPDQERGEVLAQVPRLVPHVVHDLPREVGAAAAPAHDQRGAGRLGDVQLQLVRLARATLALAW